MDKTIYVWYYGGLDMNIKNKINNKKRLKNDKKDRVPSI